MVTPEIIASLGTGAVVIEPPKFDKLSTQFVYREPDSLLAVFRKRIVLDTKQKQKIAFSAWLSVGTAVEKANRYWIIKLLHSRHDVPLLGSYCEPDVCRIAMVSSPHLSVLPISRLAFDDILVALRRQCAQEGCLNEDMGKSPYCRHCEPSHRQPLQQRDEVRSICEVCGRLISKRSEIDELCARCADKKDRIWQEDYYRALKENSGCD